MLTYICTDIAEVWVYSGITAVEQLTVHHGRPSHITGCHSQLRVKENLGSPNRRGDKLASGIPQTNLRLRPAHGAEWRLR